MTPGRRLTTNNTRASDEYQPDDDDQDEDDNEVDGIDDDEDEVGCYTTHLFLYILCTPVNWLVGLSFLCYFLTLP